MKVGLTMQREQELAQDRPVIGVDEAGRGPLAGPVVCAAAWCNISKAKQTLTALIADSKAMSEEEREESYELITRNSDVVWAVSVVSHTEIDAINILQATMVGMQRATCDVLVQIKQRHSNLPSSSLLALIDGNRVPKDMPVEAKFVIKGDSFVYSIALASILAKVTRDRIMQQLHLQFPAYNFAQHKGYPTASHRSLLLQLGPCPVHRLTFGPVKVAVEKQQGKNKESNNKEKNKNKNNAKDDVPPVASSSSKTRTKRTTTSSTKKVIKTVKESVKSQATTTTKKTKETKKARTATNTIVNVAIVGQRRSSRRTQSGNVKV